MSLAAINDDFRDVLIALHDQGAEFLIVGAHSLAVHGVPRATGDLDILIRPTPENARKVWQALMDFGAPLQVLGIDPTDFAKPGMVIQLGVPPRRIDILTSISGVDDDAAWGSRLLVDLDGRSIGVLGREALILNKKAAGRAKDLADVEALEERERRH